MTVSLMNKSRFEDKLKSILDTAELKGETGITIMTDRAWHMDVFNFMERHKKIKQIKVAGSTFFVVKHMRIEIKPIDFYL
tara:strand:+ start:590 stop:829 length:240 start_codon:yes stop_codon:yes gene_type:complete